MPAMSHRTAHSGPAVEGPEASTSTASGDSTPEWYSDIMGARGNGAAVEMITGEAMSEEAASFLLDADLESEEESTSETATSAESSTETGEQPVGDGPAPAPEREKVIPSGKLGQVYKKHDKAIPGLGEKATSEHKWAIGFFKKKYNANKARYEGVASQTGIPALLIAALHYRESSMNFNTYLHQGDPLGKQAVNHPSNIPIFYKWEDAAVHALKQKSGVRDALGMDENTTDPAALATFAERYNGLGYHNKGKPSPYVYAGTDEYQGGKYVRDGVYDPNVWDRNPGVMALMGGVEGGIESTDTPSWANPQSAEEAWAAVADGSHVVRKGQRGPAVTALQEKLVAAGHAIGVDGHFGNGTLEAVLAFQTANGLKADGHVGSSTAAALKNGGASPTTEEAPAVEAPSEAPAEESPTAPTTEELSPAEKLWKGVLQGGKLLKQGARSEYVRVLQEKLSAAGFRLGVDGDFGPRTRRMVIKFQRAMGLSPDGIVGPKTAEKL